MSFVAEAGPFADVEQAFFDGAALYPRTGVGAAILGVPMLKGVAEQQFTLTKVAAYPANIAGPRLTALAEGIAEVHGDLPIPNVPDMEARIHRGFGLPAGSVIESLVEFMQVNMGNKLGPIGKPGWTPDVLPLLEGRLNEGTFLLRATTVLAAARDVLLSNPALNLAEPYRKKMAATARIYGERMSAARSDQERGQLEGEKQGRLGAHGEELSDGVRNIMRTQLNKYRGDLGITVIQAAVFGHNITRTVPAPAWLEQPPTPK